MHACATAAAVPAVNNNTFAILENPMRIPFRSAVAALVLAGAPLAAQADVIGFTAGAGIWQQSPSGWIQEGSSDRVDLEDELGLDDETGGFVWAAFEHFIPLVPNIKLQYTALNLSGEGTTSFTIPGGTTLTGNISSTLDLDQMDVIFYYELLDNWVNLDVGINVKVIDGAIEATDGTNTWDTSFTAPLPMLYGNAVFKLPFSGWQIGLEGSYAGYSGNSLSDFKAHLGYEYGVVGVELGLRRLQLDLDDIDDISSEIKVSGPYAALFVDF